MSDNEVLYTYTADDSGVLDSLDAITAGLAGLEESIASLADAASGLTVLDDALASVAEMFSGLDASAGDAAGVLEGVVSEADAAAEALGALGTAGEGVAALGSEAADAAAQVGELSVAASDVATAAGDAASEIDGLNSVIASMSATIAEDTAIIDGLNGSVIALEAQISALTVEEAGAEASTGGLGAMMGSLGEMAGGAGAALSNAGEALQSAQGPLLMISMASVAAGKSVFDMGTKAEDALNRVQALAGVGAADMATYTSELEAQGLKFGETLDQEANGLYDVTSAGFKNADAMKVMEQAVEDAKAGHVELHLATDALTSSMNAYGASADEAQHYNDLMITAVTQGKQSFGAFASAISKAATEGHAAKISFDQVTAAEATLTQQGMSARQASMDLTSMMKAMDGDIDKTAKTAAGLGLNFDEAAYKTMDLFHQMTYLQEITKGNQTEINKLTGGSAGLAAFNALVTKNADGSYKFANSLDAMKNSTGAAATAFQTSQQTISSHIDQVTAKFSMLSYKIVEVLGPKLIPLIDNVSNAIGKFTDYVTTHIDQLMPVFAGLAAFFGGAIIGAIAAFVTTLGPVVAVIAGISAAVAGVVYAYQHWGDIMGQVNTVMQNPVIKEIMRILQDIGGFLAATFIPVWQQLVTTWQTQLLPAFAEMAPILDPLKMLLGAIAMIVGVVLVVGLGLLVGAVKGVVEAFAALLTGIIQAVGGAVQFVMGFVTVISGILAFLIDLITGNWSKLGTDLQAIWDGILNILYGFGNIFMGIFGGLFLGVYDLIVGFGSGVIDFFLHLYDVLVGHSIIPDMINAIFDWFAKLPEEALKWGSDMVSNFAGGINDTIGQITQACSNIASTIASWLHFSKPDVGPLASSDQWMKDFGDQLSSGLNDQQGKVKASSDNVAGAISNSDLSKLGDTAKNIVKAFSNIAKEIDKVFGPIGKSLTSLDNLSKHIDDMAKSSQKTVDAFGKLGGAIKESTKPVHDAEKVFDSLKESLNKAFNAINDAAPKFKKLEPAFKDLQKPVEEAAKELKTIGDAITHAMKPVNDALGHLSNLEKSTGKVAQNAKDTTKAFNDLGPAISKDAKEADNSHKKFEALGPALKKAEDAIKASLPEFKAIAPALKDAEKPISDAISAYKKIAEAIDNAFKPIVSALNGLHSMKDALDHMADAITKTVKGFNDLAPAIGKSHDNAVNSVKPYGDLQAAMNRVGTEVNNQLPKFKTLEQTLRNQEGPLKTATENYRKISDALKEGFGPINTALEGFKKFPNVITSTHGPLTQMTKDFDDLENKIEKSCGNTLRIVNNFGKTFEKQFDDLRAVTSAKSTDIAKGIENQLGSTLQQNGFTWGSDFMTQFIAGIQSQQGNLNATVSSIANTISSQLHHTKPETGPLADDDQWGSHFIDNLSKGIDGSLGKIKASTMGVAQTLAGINPSNLPTGPSSQGLGGGGNPQALLFLSQIAQGIQQIQRQQLTPPANNQLGAITQQFGTMNFNGINDPNALYQAINQLMGQQQEYSARGAIFNY